MLFYAACEKISDMENFEPNYKMHDFTYLYIMVEPIIWYILSMSHASDCFNFNLINMQHIVLLLYIFNIQREELEPAASAVLRPRLNQLHRLCRNINVVTLDMPH